MRSLSHKQEASGSGSLSDLSRLAHQCVEAETSAREQEHRELKESERHYREIFENAKDAIYVHDLKGRYTLVNKACEELIGYTREEILQMSVFDVVASEDVDFIRNSLEQKLAHHAPTTYEVDAIRKDGRRVPVEVSSRLIYRDGKPVGVQGTARDISERRRAEEALRASEQRLRDLVENANDIIFTCDMAGNITSLNRAGQRLTGYSADEAVTMNFDQAVAPQDIEKVRQMLSRKRVADVTTVYEIEIITKSGGRAEVEISSRAILKDGEPIGVQGIARDITERKRMEHDLQASQVQLRQSQKLEAIGQLAGGVAHDFNNLLTAINGYSGLARRHLGNDHPIAPYLHEIEKAGNRAANLTRQLLAFGRKQLLQPLSLNLNDVVTDMSKMLTRLIGESIALETKLSPDLKRIKADPGQVEQVLMNLVVNARDAMPKGGVLMIETTNEELDDAYANNHISVKPGKYVMLAVSDTGMGMDQEVQAHIFEPFYTTKEKGKGTGLGLSTVYGIIKQSGGNVWLYSEPGKGTSFKVYLPVNEVEIAAPFPATPDTSLQRGSETVLLVEDEEIVRKIIKRLLEENGYRVLQAGSGEEAISLFTRHQEPIDLLITDVVMPKLSGKDVADQIRSVHPETKVLYMSGYTDEAIVHHGIVDADIEFIQKPFTERALTRKLREVLDAETPPGEASDTLLNGSDDG